MNLNPNSCHTLPANEEDLLDFMVTLIDKNIDQINETYRRLRLTYEEQVYINARTRHKVFKQFNITQ
jgi:hypothetical protein